MVPYKGTKAETLRQNVKNKPHKWGFKIYCRSSSSGIVHDLLLYQGTKTFCVEGLHENEKDFLLGKKVMLVLCRSIPNPSSCAVFCDNFFVSYKLVKKFIERMKLKNQRLLRWSLTLQPYSLNIRHIKGTDNLIADALSRA